MLLWRGAVFVAKKGDTMSKKNEHVYYTPLNRPVPAYSLVEIDGQLFYDPYAEIYGGTGSWYDLGNSIADKTSSITNGSITEIFSTDLPDIAAMIKALDMMNEEVNACVREGIHRGAEIIVREQRRLIEGKSERLSEAISTGRVHVKKKGVLGIQSGYLSEAFDEDADGFNAGVIGTMFEFGRPGTSTAHHRNSPTMKQIRLRIPNKKTAKKYKWAKAVPTEVDISKGTIQPVPHIRRGFDNKVNEAVDTVIESVNTALEKLEKKLK